MTSLAHDLKNYGLAYTVAAAVTHFSGPSSVGELLTVAASCFVLALVAYGVGVARSRAHVD